MTYNQRHSNHRWHPELKTTHYVLENSLKTFRDIQTNKLFYYITGDSADKRQYRGDRPISPNLSCECKFVQ